MFSPQRRVSASPRGGKSGSLDRGFVGLRPRTLTVEWLGREAGTAVGTDSGGTTLRRTLAIGAVALAAALASSAALAGQSYTDPTGDSTTAADIIGIAVVNDVKGNVSFRISWAGGQLLPKDDVVYLAIDTDRNALTGGEEGEEVVLEFDGDPGASALGIFLDGRWDGAEIDYDWIARSARTRFRPGGVDVLINTSDLNGATTFDFWVYSDQYSGDDIVAEDIVPDGSAVYTYKLAPTPTRRAVRLGAGKPWGTPGAPHAGKRFAVAVHVARTDARPVTRATVRCSVHAGRKVVRAVGGFSRGFARCRMTVPKGMKGTMLRGAVSIAIAGAKTTKPFAFKIR